MHMLASQLSGFDVTIILAYLLLVAFLGWLGYSRTKNATDYMVAGRKAHPVIMALSYGATFISTSAIVGFGGVAGAFGMSVLWLTFLNIFVGIFIAFVVMGGRVRHIGHSLDAHTFPELIGRRFQSRGIQVFAGLVIFGFMPLYAAAVIIGGVEFISTQFEIDYNVAMLVFALIVAAYVLAGGLKAVMYTDALQGVIMFVGMMALLVYAYYNVGGVTAGHQALTNLKDLVSPQMSAIGHRGWTAMPEFGFGSHNYDLWWTVISTIVLGVGIGVLAQPQLCVRFMTVKSKRELNRAVAVGGIFILAMTGVAFTVGALSNAYFTQHGAPITGRVIKTLNADGSHAMLQVMQKDASGQWKDVPGKPVPVVLGEDRIVFPSLDGSQPAVVQGRSLAITYAGGNSDQIIPVYIRNAMPPWFGLLFLLTLLAAAMSTLSSQFHASGTSLGHDVYGTISGKRGSVGVTRVAIIIGLILAVLVGLYARGGMIIARATSIFFGLCASAFLPTLVGGLYWKRMTRVGALASIAVGFIVTSFWLLFVKSAEADALGLVMLLTGKKSILQDYPNWPVMDPIVVALPLSAVVAVLVSLMTQPPSAEHLAKCFSPKKSIAGAATKRPAEMANVGK